MCLKVHATHRKILSLEVDKGRRLETESRIKEKPAREQVFVQDSTETQGETIQTYVLITYNVPSMVIKLLRFMPLKSLH